MCADSSLLVSALAVVLSGKGIAGLQEAGWLPISPVPSPRIELLGLYPSWQTLAAQLCVLLAAQAAAVPASSSSQNLERTSP